MPERWLAQLQKIDRVEPSYDLLERAEAGPFLPEPGPRPMTRAAIVLVAALVAAAGSWGAFAALRGVGGTDGVAGRDPDAFEALWPETSISEARQVQARVDAGDPDVQWRTLAGDVALSYAEQVLGWPAPIAGVTTGPETTDTAIVSIHGPVASCQGAECQEWQPQEIRVILTLQRLVRSGDGGIWSVTGVASADTRTTAEPRPRIGGWPEDANGDGSISDTGDERIPELIMAVGNKGISGYVRYEDTNSPEPSSPTEALAMSGKSYVIPVYAADGITVVHWYTVSSDDGSPSPPPSG
jgi:hypothetical protein